MGVLQLDELPIAHPELADGLVFKEAPDDIREAAMRTSESIAQGVHLVSE